MNNHGIDAWRVVWPMLVALMLVGLGGKLLIELFAR